MTKSNSVILLFLILFTLSLSCKLTPTVKKVGHVNNLGNYGFNYPSNWNGIERGSDVRFEFDGIKVEIIVNPIMVGNDLETMQSQLGASVEQVKIGNEPALKQDVYGDSGVLIGRIYHTFHNNFQYTILVLTDSNYIGSTDFSSILEFFEELIKSFRFLS
jgi:hypothetical protein